MKREKILSVQVIPVQDMIAYSIDTIAGEVKSYDIFAIRVVIYENGTTAWYPINMEDIVNLSILDSNDIDIYWDYIKYKGVDYGHVPEGIRTINHFKDKVV